MGRGRKFQIFEAIAEESDTQGQTDSGYSTAERRDSENGDLVSSDKDKSSRIVEVSGERGRAKIAICDVTEEKSVKNSLGGGGGGEKGYDASNKPKVHRNWPSPPGSVRVVLQHGNKGKSPEKESSNCEEKGCYDGQEVFPNCLYFRVREVYS